MASGGIGVLVWRYSVTSSETKRISSCCHGEATDLVVHYTSGLHLAAGLRREEDLGEGASSRQVSIFFVFSYSFPFDVQKKTYVVSVILVGSGEVPIGLR